MKTGFLVLLLFAGTRGLAQCVGADLTGTGNHCAGDTLTVHGSGALSQIEWYNGGQLVKTINGTVTATSSFIVAGGNGYGNAANQLNLPSQIYLDGNGNLFVADNGNGRIQKFPPGSTSATNGVTIAKPINSNSFTSGVCLDSKGNIFFTDVSGVTLDEWTPGASAVKLIASVSEPGVVVNDIGEIFVDAAGYVYVPEDNRVLKITPATGTSVIVAGGSTAGYGPDQLNAPSGIWVDNAGNMYIADNGNQRIQKWAPGATSGVTVAGGNGVGSKPNQLNHPVNLCVDGAGNMYIADCFNSRIQEWKAGATEGITVAGGVGEGNGSDQLDYPTDVVLDGKGYMYISDNYNERVLKWQLATSSVIDSTFITDEAGTYTAALTGNDGCTLTTNAIVIRPTIQANLGITATPSPVCANDSVLFTAHLAGNGFNPSWQWLVNGASAGGDSAAYFEPRPSNGEVISCRVTDESVCMLGTSNSITLAIDPVPDVAPEQVIGLPYGQSIMLSPTLSGDISTYSWSPATGLSDTTIRDPIADPLVTTQYTLQVAGPDGCSASGTITVKVYTQLRVPNAFTPNGDGHNDVFYILNGPPGSIIKNFAVFNRWGQRVFQVHGVAPGDPAYGWNGYSGGSPALSGAYVYEIEMKFANGQSQVFKGTVMLLR